MDFMRLVTEARTCRRFLEDRPLTQQDLRWLLECARRASSARNAQELRFMTVTGETVASALKYAHWAGALKDWPGPGPGEQPTGLIAVLVPEKAGNMIYIDVGIACQTIQLAATSKGWGTCMMQAFDHAEITALLSPPAGSKVELLIWAGIAAEVRQLVKMPPNGDVRYWRDEKQVHYVPKRDLDDLIVQVFEK